MARHELTYSVYPETLQGMEARGVDIPFAIKYFKGVAYEFNAVFALRNDLTLPASKPRKSYCVNRQAQKVSFEAVPNRFFDQRNSAEAFLSARLLGAPRCPQQFSVFLCPAEKSWDLPPYDGSCGSLAVTDK